MKLRNKKTGEIGRMVCTDLPLTTIHTTNGGVYDYKTLAEINEEWEDYEEPKEYWVVDYITSGIDTLTEDYKDPDVDNFNKEIGNYFETREEAEKAVEKLKAWKRLKDTGFEFKGWKVVFDQDSPRIYFNVYRKNSDDIVPFLDLLFGGKE